MPSLSPQRSRRHNTPAPTSRRPSIVKLPKELLKHGNQFAIKYNSKHHPFDHEKAPYPMCYDRQILDLEPIDFALCKYLRNSVSFHGWDRDKPPTRVLDLGCGLGCWIIEAAKQWPECTFVGFDMMNVHIPSDMLDPRVAQRIEWVNGNFLTSKLPFDDDEFDYVHVFSINHGVPENKWSPLYEELSRVMCPGAVIEHFEEDILFPKLPKWFTNPLRGRPQELPVQRHLHKAPPPASLPKPTSDRPHAHAFIESLFYDVFQNRFINIKPTSVLPIYFCAFFKVLEVGPITEVPMPPFTLQPQPSSAPLPISRISTIGTHSSHSDWRSSIETRQHALSFSSISSSSTVSLNSTYSSDASDSDTIFSPTPRKGPANPEDGERDTTTPIARPDNADSFGEDFESDLKPIQIVRTTIPNIEKATGEYSVVSSHAILIHDNVVPQDQRPEQAMVTEDMMNTLGERSLIMHLRRGYQAVLSCREAMWEELKCRLLNQPDDVMFEGWDDDLELQELPDRKKFETLIERYQSDMHKRLTLWASLSARGGTEWPLPRPASISKIELAEEERLREAMIEAMKETQLPENAPLSRSLRVLIGTKPSSEEEGVF